MPLVTSQGYQLVPDAGQAIAQGVRTAGNIQQQRRLSQNQQNQEQLRMLLGQGNIEQAREQFPVETQAFEQQQTKLQKQKFDALDAETQTGLKNFTIRSAQALTLPADKVGDFLQKEIAQGSQAGIDMSDSQEVLNLYKKDPQAAIAQLQETARFGQDLGFIGQGTSAGQREFDQLTAGLTEADKEKARRIKAGLDPRAVGSAAQTIAGSGTAEQVGESQAIIKQREKFGEMTGASRAKTIDKGFDRIVKINSGLDNIDRAIKALEGGAKTGAIQRFLPSIRSASVELNQIRNELALDVLNSATFGALSEKELELTKETALPTGLDENQLIQHLKDRKTAQEKLRSYFQEQIDFLDNGGTVAGFLRMKERETQDQTQQTQQPDNVLSQADAILGL